MKRTYQPKTDKKKENMDLWKEWKQDLEEMYLKQEDKKVEKN